MVSSLAQWKSIILMNSSFWEIHQQYFFIIVITQGYCSLTYINPESVPSSFFQAHSFQFMCEASGGDPLSPLSPGSPFCPAEPWIPGCPFAPFFPSAPGGPWVPFFPGYPGLLWLHLDQVAQGLVGRMSCMSTSRFARHYYKMDKMEQAANGNQSVSNVWEAALVSLFRILKRLNELPEIGFEFPFILIGKSTKAFLTGQSWRLLKSW